MVGLSLIRVEKCDASWWPKVTFVHFPLQENLPNPSTWLCNMPTDELSGDVTDVPLTNRDSKAMVWTNLALNAPDQVVG